MNNNYERKTFMNQEENVSNTEQITKPIQKMTVGQRLCQAREKTGLTIADISDQLRIASHFLESIESDSHQGKDITYLRGYLRNYARLLKIPESEVDQMLTDLGWKFSENKTPEIPISTINTKQISLKDKPARLATYIIISILIILTIVWRYSHRGIEETFEVQNMEESSAIQPIENITTPTIKEKKQIQPIDSEELEILQEIQ